MIDELSRREHRGHELEAVDDRVEPPLQQADQVFAGVAASAHGLGVDPVELAFGEVAVNSRAASAWPKAECRNPRLAAPLAMFAGAVLALVRRALGTPPEVYAEAAANLVLRTTNAWSFGGLRDGKTRGTARGVRGRPFYTDAAPLVKPIRPNRAGSWACAAVARPRRRPCWAVVRGLPPTPAWGDAPNPLSLSWGLGPVAPR